MDYDDDKIDEMTLALLWLVTWNDGYGPRAWKGHSWSVMDRLHAKGYISDPKGKAKSVMLTEKGKAKSEALFQRFFAKLSSSQPSAKIGSRRKSAGSKPRRRADKAAH